MVAKAVGSGPVVPPSDDESDELGSTSHKSPLHSQHVEVVEPASSIEVVLPTTSLPAITSHPVKLDHSHGADPLGLRH